MTVLFTGRRIVLSSRADPLVLRYATVSTSHINVFIMMLTTTAVYMATVGAMEIWTLWQESSGLWLLCVGGDAHFR